MGIKYFLKAGNLKTMVAPFKKIFTALRERIRLERKQKSGELLKRNCFMQSKKSTAWLLAEN